MNYLNAPFDSDNGIEITFIDGTKDWFDPILEGNLVEENGLLKIWGGEPHGWQFPVSSIESIEYYKAKEEAK